MGLRSQSIWSLRVNHPVAASNYFVTASNYFVTASGARQSITAHLDDGWPRCARHDAFFVSASEEWQSITVRLEDGWPRCARHDAFFVSASEARQSITAHLDDGWPRCARHDTGMDGRAALAITPAPFNKGELGSALAAFALKVVVGDLAHHRRQQHQRH